MATTAGKLSYVQTDDETELTSIATANHTRHRPVSIAGQENNQLYAQLQSQKNSMSFNQEPRSLEHTLSVNQVLGHKLKTHG